MSFSFDVVTLTEVPVALLLWKDCSRENLAWELQYWEQHPRDDTLFHILPKEALRTMLI